MKTPKKIAHLRFIIFVVDNQNIFNYANRLEPLYPTLKNRAKEFMKALKMSLGNLI